MREQVGTDSRFIFQIVRIGDNYIPLFPTTAPSGALKKRRRQVVADVSKSFVLSLLETPLGELVTPADVRRILAEPLRANVLMSEDFLQLSLACDGIIPFEIQDSGVHDSAMPRLCSQLQFIFDNNVTCGSEKVWATVADTCTGSMWRTLSSLHGVFPFRDDRNRSDASGATAKSLRPDYTAYCSGALVAKAEHKATPLELQAALQELLAKMNGGWNPLAMRGMPFLPCYAVGGELLQFAVVLPPTGGAAMSVVTVSHQFILTTPQGRLGVVKAACNMFRILVWLQSRMPVDPVQLYVEQKRLDGGSITVYDNHVVKLTRTVAAEAVYVAVSQIPHAIRIAEVKPPRFGGDGMTRLKLEPVAIERLPRDETELQAAVRCVLVALAAFHSRGFVHHDVRWPNVLFAAAGDWILSDFELAGTIGSPTPLRAVNPTLLPPEARVDGSLYATSADIWQVGQLVLTAKLLVLSAAGAAFAEQLTAEQPDMRPTATAALASDWLRLG
jgi:hypothetical protein